MTFDFELEVYTKVVSYILRCPGNIVLYTYWQLFRHNKRLFQCIICVMVVKVKARWHLRGGHALAQVRPSVCGRERR